MKTLLLSNEPRNYRVRWEREVYALSPQHAAMVIAKEHFNHKIGIGSDDENCAFDVLGYRCQQKGVWHEETADRVNLYTLGADMSVDDLRELFGIAGHRIYDTVSWKSAVMNGSTWKGYWDWLAECLNAKAKSEQEQEE